MTTLMMLQIQIEAAEKKGNSCFHRWCMAVVNDDKAGMLWWKNRTEFWDMEIQRLRVQKEAWITSQSIHSV